MLFYFHFPYSFFPYDFVVRQINALQTTVYWCNTEDINTENAVIKGSNPKGQKPPFRVSVNLSDIFKTQMIQNKQSFCVTTSRREKDCTKPIIFMSCILSRAIRVSVKILTSLFRFLQNWSARFCFKRSLLPPKLSYIML